MQEREVTVGQETLHLPEPFFVIATQNPIEQEGTYPLPEAQLDRFMFDIRVGYPSLDEEEKILAATTKGERPGAEEGALGQGDREPPEAGDVGARSPSTRSSTSPAWSAPPGPADPNAPPFVKELVDWGAGPRAGQALILGGKAMAAMDGRFSVSLRRHPQGRRSRSSGTASAPTSRHRPRGKQPRTSSGACCKQSPNPIFPSMRNAANRVEEAPRMATHQDHILRLGKADEDRYLSSEEFATADFEEPWRYERMDGRLAIVSPAGENYRRSAVSWRNRLIRYEFQNPEIIDLVDTEAWIRVDGGTDRIGDIGVYLKIRESIPSIPDRVPELMFEIVSPGRVSRERDYVRKRAEYHRLGIREYVVIDRRQKTVNVFRWEPDGYAESVLTGDAVYTTPLLPGLAIPLNEVFETGPE